MTKLTDERLLSMAAKALGYASIDPDRGAEEGPGSFREALEVFPEELIAFARAVLAVEPPAPAPAADGERDHVPGAGNMVPAAYAARLRQCPTHGQLPANAWGCPECLRELREELAKPKAPAAGAEEREAYAQWLDRRGAMADLGVRNSYFRAADLLRQPAHAPVPVWQPIDTAPHDGTEILASDYDAIEILTWSWDAWETGSGWIDRNGQRLFPAWWQPLPDHPPIPQPPQPTPTEPSND